MQHDLNFWQEPDWKRESSISPVFLMMVVVALFVLVGGAAASWAFHGRLTLQNRLADLSARNARIEKEALAAKDHRRKSEMWDRVLKQLDKRVAENLRWSLQLRALQELVPDDIRFDTLAVRTEQVLEHVAVQGKPGRDELRLQYVMTINGRARGANAQKTIARFLENLAPGAHPLPDGGPSLSVAKEPHLNFISGADGSATEKSFAIVCVFAAPETAPPAKEVSHGR